MKPAPPPTSSTASPLVRTLDKNSCSYRLLRLVPLTWMTLAGFKSVIIPVSLIALVVYISFTLGDMCARLG